MRRYRKILHISYKDHVTNEEVHAKIQHAIGPHEDLLTIIKRCKLQWYGHVSRSSGLAKTILQGTVKGRRKQGRQRKRWEDNIREWTGLEFASPKRAVENRGKRRKLVVKSPVLPQRPWRLRDRWDERIIVIINPGRRVRPRRHRRRAFQPFANRNSMHSQMIACLTITFWKAHGETRRYKWMDLHSFTQRRGSKVE